MNRIWSGVIVIFFLGASSGVATTVLAQDRRDPRNTCYRDNLPARNITNDRKETEEACTQLLKSEPTNPLAYYYRASSRADAWSRRYDGRGMFEWNKSPYFNTGIYSQQDIKDYENALKYGIGPNALALPNRAKIHMDLGYAYAHNGRMEWSKALRNWHKAIEEDPNLRQEIAPRILFAQERLIEIGKILDSPPSQCSQLSYWECKFVKGCSKRFGSSWSNGKIGSADIAYKGCSGVSAGILPIAASLLEIDCALIDEAYCGRLKKCQSNRKRRSYCIPGTEWCFGPDVFGGCVQKQ